MLKRSLLLACAAIAIALALDSGDINSSAPAAPRGTAAPTAAPAPDRSAEDNQLDGAPIVLDLPDTYCNPMNLDYAFAPNNKVHTYTTNNSHRSTADPVCVLYKDKYFLFSTNQEGYWCSDDLRGWRFIAHQFKMNSSGDQVCAPAAWPTDRGLLFLPCFDKKDEMPLYVSKNPEKNQWAEATSSFAIPAWDPSLFQDDDGRLYMYWGSSNVYPLYGVELDPDNGYKPVGKPIELIRLHPEEHGWEQFGENNQNGTMNPFIEGAWMNKFTGKYYLQYGAPGTEFNVYADGVYTADKPLGPFKYQAHNPFSSKPTGFIRGAGHGSTFSGRYGNLWHVASMVVGIKHKFERRLGLFPAAVDKDGILYADTSFGDYPHFVPAAKSDPKELFAGWMLLSYKKHAWSSDGSSDPALAFDEDIKTYWSAPDAAKGRFLAVDLGGQREVSAIQINYADEKAQSFGKQLDAHHSYKIYRSDDGKRWYTLADRSTSLREVPHDYLQFDVPISTRYVKLENIEMPTGCFAIGDLRIFGRAIGDPPLAVEGFTARRDAKDARNLSLKWKKVHGAYAYNISYGVAPDKLYSSLLVYDSSNYDLHSLNIGSPYFFRIQSVGETGISPASAIVKVK